jgi:hypothetical protein
LVVHFSDFSTICYAIYKNQETHFTISVALLQQGPWKELFLCNVALAASSGVPAEIPAGNRRGPAGDGGERV